MGFERARDKVEDLNDKVRDSTGRNLKGTSPAIAVVLLIGVTVTAAGSATVLVDDVRDAVTTEQPDSFEFVIEECVAEEKDGDYKVDAVVRNLESERVKPSNLVISVDAKDEVLDKENIDYPEEGVGAQETFTVSFEVDSVEDERPQLFMAGGEVEDSAFCSTVGDVTTLPSIIDETLPLYDPVRVETRPEALVDEGDGSFEARFYVKNIGGSDGENVEYDINIEHSDTDFEENVEDTFESIKSGQVRNTVVSGIPMEEGTYSYEFTVYNTQHENLEGAEEGEEWIERTLEGEITVAGDEAIHEGGDTTQTISWGTAGSAAITTFTGADRNLPAKVIQMPNAEAPQTICIGSECSESTGNKPVEPFGESPFVNQVQGHLNGTLTVNQIEPSSEKGLCIGSKCRSRPGNVKTSNLYAADKDMDGALVLYGHNGEDRGFIPRDEDLCIGSC